MKVQRSMHRKPENTQLNKKNQGYTLIEVLISMAILAIATLPILSSFASAAKINSKSRRQENANSLVQELTERFKALSLTQLLADTTYGMTCTGSDASGNYTFQTAECSVGGDSSSNRFYATIELSPNKSITNTSTGVSTITSTPYEINSYDMPVFADVNDADKHNYVIMNQLFQNDSGVADEFRNQFPEISDIDGVLEEDIYRKVTVDVSGNTIKTKVWYYAEKVMIDENHVVTALEATPAHPVGTTIVRQVEDGSRELNTDTYVYTDTLTNIENIYLFYSAYDRFSGLTVARDTFEINLDNSTMKTYFVEQAVTQSGNNTVVSLDSHNISTNKGSLFYTNVAGYSGAKNITQGEPSDKKYLYTVKIKIYTSQTDMLNNRNKFLEVTSTKEN